MLITNYGPIPHRYQEPGASGGRYFWHPGQTVDVPDSVGRLMLQHHPAKFVDSNPGVADYVTTDMQSQDYATEVATPSVNNTVCSDCGRTFKNLAGVKLHKLRKHRGGD